DSLPFWDWPDCGSGCSDRVLHCDIADTLPIDEDGVNHPLLAAMLPDGWRRGGRKTAKGASMRDQSKAAAWWRAVVPTVSWTLVCLMAMSLVFSVVAGA